MSRSVALSNKLVMNKYLWMSHQLRHFNDVGSIINWSNAMNLVKGLLFEPLSTAPTPTSSILPSVRHPPSQPLFSISNPHISSINIPPVPLSNHDARSITPPTTISFKPIKKMPLTKPLTLSPARTSSYTPSKPPQLTISTHCQPELSPTNSLTQCPKRRKLTLPPSVEKRKTMLPPQVELTSTSTHLTSAPNPTIIPQAKTIDPPSSNLPAVNATNYHYSPRKSKREKAMPKLHLNKLTSMDKDYTEELALLTRDAANANTDRLTFLAHNQNRYPLCSWYYY